MTGGVSLGQTSRCVNVELSVNLSPKGHLAILSSAYGTCPEGKARRRQLHPKCGTRESADVPDASFGPSSVVWGNSRALLKAANCRLESADAVQQSFFLLDDLLAILPGV